MNAGDWAVDSIPALAVAGTAPDGEIVFESASGATRLSDGTIVIGDGMASAVRFVSREGTLLNTVGREGRGPAEFSSIQWLGQCGEDSVFVWGPIRHPLLQGSSVAHETASSR